MKTAFARQMHVQIALDSPHSTWTNLDILRGKVLVRLFGQTPLTSVVVKLEGESHTRLKAPPRSDPGRVDGVWEDWGGEKPMVREEAHKILYKTAVVFPAEQPDIPPSSTRFVTLSPGSYELPFSFKASTWLFPFNNACKDSAPSAAASLAQVARLGLKSAAGNTPPIRHVKRALPPTVTTFPGVAEIRYYLKVTVNRKEFYKENPRVVQNLNFFPIEPPRQTPTDAESYARRQHQFMSNTGMAGKGKSRMIDAFKKTSSSPAPDSTPSDPPLVSVEIRLPNPPIITCNEDLPLRVVVKRVNASSEPLILQSLHVQLHGITQIKANEIFRDEASNWVVVSKSNMGLALRSSKPKEVLESGEEIVLDPKLWKEQPLPNSVSPSFATCNISRKYELEVHVGIGFQSSHANNTVVLPLRHPVQVYSGIAPPAALLAAMDTKRVPSRKPVQKRAPEKSAALTTPAHLQTDIGPSSVVPATSQEGPSTPIKTPVEANGNRYGPLPPGEEEPPPSYEDAIGQEMPPVTGPRREYQPPPMATGGFSDEKGRRDS